MGIDVCGKCGSQFLREGSVIVPSRPELAPIDKAVLVDNILSCMNVEGRPGIAEIHEWILNNIPSRADREGE